MHDGKEIESLRELVSVGVSVGVGGWVMGVGVVVGVCVGVCVCVCVCGCVCLRTPVCLYFLTNAFYFYI